MTGHHTCVSYPLFMHQAQGRQLTLVTPLSQILLEAQAAETRSAWPACRQLHQSPISVTDWPVDFMLMKPFPAHDIMLSSYS